MAPLWSGYGLRAANLLLNPVNGSTVHWGDELQYVKARLAEHGKIVASGDIAALGTQVADNT